MVANTCILWYNNDMVLLDGPMSRVLERPTDGRLKPQYDSVPFVAPSETSPQIVLTEAQTWSARLALANADRVKSSHPLYNTPHEPVSELWTTELFEESAASIESVMTKDEATRLKFIDENMTGLIRAAALLVSQYPRPLEVSAEELAVISARRNAAHNASRLVHKLWPEPYPVRDKNGNLLAVPASKTQSLSA